MDQGIATIIAAIIGAAGLIANSLITKGTATQPPPAKPTEFPSAGSGVRPALVCAIVGILDAIITTHTGPLFHAGQLFGFNSRPIFPYQLVIGPLCGFAFYYFCKSTILRSFLAGLFLAIVPILLREIPIDSFLMFAYSIPLVLAPLIAFETVDFRRHLLQSLLYISLSAGLTILGWQVTILGLQVSGDTNAWFQSARSGVLWFCYAYFFFRLPLAAHEKVTL